MGCKQNSNSGCDRNYYYSLRWQEVFRLMFMWPPLSLCTLLSRGHLPFAASQVDCSVLYALMDSLSSCRVCGRVLWAWCFKKPQKNKNKIYIYISQADKSVKSAGQVTFPRRGLIFSGKRVTKRSHRHFCCIHCHSISIVIFQIKYGPITPFQVTSHHNCSSLGSSKGYSYKQRGFLAAHYTLLQHFRSDASGPRWTLSSPTDG